MENIFLKIELIDYMGTDLTVVNAARVSMDKESDWEYGDYCEQCNDHHGPYLSEKDQKLIKYLARENHFTPFTHAIITVRETVPIFVARQRFKHQIGFTYNEVSRRYVDDTPTFYTPDVWRSRPEGSVKQGSGDGVVTSILKPDLYSVYGKGTEVKKKSLDIQTAYEEVVRKCTWLYEDMIEAGVAPEQARMVLPQSMNTSYYCTGSLAAFARAYKLRSDSHSQKEIQILSSGWDKIIRPLFPHSWSALVD